MVYTIKEYTRHNGHADRRRESAYGEGRNHEREDLAAAVSRGKRRGGLTSTFRGGVRALSHRGVRGQRGPSGRNRQANRRRDPLPRYRPPAGGRDRAPEWELDMPADPTAVQTVQVSIDAHVSADVQPFWCARSDTGKWGPRT